MLVAALWHAPFKGVQGFSAILKGFNICVGVLQGSDCVSFFVATAPCSWSLLFEVFRSAAQVKSYPTLKYILNGGRFSQPWAAGFGSNGSWVLGFVLALPPTKMETPRSQ